MKFQWEHFRGTPFPTKINDRHRISIYRVQQEKHTDELKMFSNRILSRELLFHIFLN